MLGTYTTDLGTIHYAANLAVLALTERPNEPTPPAVDFIPPSIRALYGDGDWEGCALPGITKRFVQIVSTQFDRYKIEIPVSPVDPLWSSAIAEIKNDIRIASWEYTGERITEGKIKLILR